jgi:hypothetical protein
MERALRISKDLENGQVGINCPNVVAIEFVICLVSLAFGTQPSLFIVSLTEDGRSRELVASWAVGIC